MDRNAFWSLIDEARARAGANVGVGAGGDGEAMPGEARAHGGGDGAVAKEAGVGAVAWEVRVGGDEAVAQEAVHLLAVRPREDILAFDRILDELMAESYRHPLWGAAYTINGGCSNDAFDYFRGWLIGQGRETFERAVADPDSLAGLPAVQEAAREWIEFENEAMLSIAWNAYRRVFFEDPPEAAWTVTLPDLRDGWDFDDFAETRRRLPRLAALYERHYAD
jgi:hypothetical protein